jgi:16S rRNA (cytidine1402-2'-O)-methyltransferase
MVRNSDSYDKEIKKRLYLVSTPIGNLGDITLRAIDALKKSDYILCEDTRVSKVLLDKYAIKSKLISNHKFNEKKNISKILGLLKNDSIVSIISDAGTPVISDPGAILVNECIKHNIEIIPMPGPSAVLSAVSVSGFSEKFFFYGFFPEKKKLLEDDLKNLSYLDSSIVFFISSKKINRVIPYLKKNFTGRKILICREMTKYYEEFIRAEVDEIDKLNFELKGELTLVISEKKSDKKTSQTLGESDKRMIRKMINKLSIKEIVSLVNQNNRMPKKEIYNYCLQLKNEK